MKKTRGTFLAFLILLALNCQRDKTPLKLPYGNGETGRVHLEYSAGDSLEAFEFALWFSREVTPPDSLVGELLYNINLLRYIYGDSYPSILSKNVRFLTPWKRGELAVEFDDSTATLVRNGQYNGWNSLAKNLQPRGIIDDPDVMGIALISVSDSLNPLRLAKFYKHLPGILWAEPNYRSFSTLSGFPFFPGYKDGEFTYLFVLPPGMTQLYFYFKYINGRPVYMGTWQRLRGDRPPPDWWPEARENISQFVNWAGG